MNGSKTRRSFLQATAASAAFGPACYARIRGSNDRIGLGFIGYGLIGKRHLFDFQAFPDIEIRGIAEAHSGRLTEALAQAGGAATGYSDFRHLLDRKDIQAVVISTPDHWHALMMMMACAAGKDVYVEKPLTLFVREGRWMVEAAKKHNRIVQVGTQQRSGKHYQAAKDLVRQGRIGKLLAVRMGSSRNIMPGFGTPADGTPPAALDWNMFLGPAPLRPYNPNRGIYHFRWFWDSSGGQMTNLGHHSLDIVRWLTDADPLVVYSAGGRLCLRDNGETPDTQDALFTYSGFTAHWSHREGSAGQRGVGAMELFGTEGSMTLSRTGYVLTPDRKINPATAVPQFTPGGHPVGSPAAAKELGSPAYWTKPASDASGSDREQFQVHARNFLDCIKSRSQPASDIESSHRVSTACHLANISLRVGRSLKWDAANESIVGDAEANGMLERGYRAPWDKVLDSLKVR